VVDGLMLAVMLLLSLGKAYAMHRMWSAWIELELRQERRSRRR
jgi:hypothetical protein